MNKFLLSMVFILSLVVESCKPSTFYSINGFGKLELLGNKRFYFDLFEHGNDTGFYEFSGDTIFLTSSKKSVEFSPLSNANQESFPNKKGFEISVLIIEPTNFVFEDQTFLIDYCSTKADTILQMDFSNRVYVENMFLKEGTILVFSLFRENRYLVPRDTIFNGYFQLQNPFDGKFLTFNRFPLILRRGCLLPLNKNKNEEFRMVNNIELLPLMGSIKKRDFFRYK